jgi:hypothetical protein
MRGKWEKLYGYQQVWKFDYSLLVLRLRCHDLLLLVVEVGGRLRKIELRARKFVHDVESFSDK